MLHVPVAAVGFDMDVGEETADGIVEGCESES